MSYSVASSLETAYHSWHTLCLPSPNGSSTVLVCVQDNAPHADRTNGDAGNNASDMDMCISIGPDRSSSSNLNAARSTPVETGVTSTSAKQMAHQLKQIGNCRSSLQSKKQHGVCVQKVSKAQARKTRVASQSFPKNAKQNVEWHRCADIPARRRQEPA